VGFWGSLFGGSNPTLSSGIKQAGDTSTWATGKGKELTNQGANWLTGILSGDTAKTAKLLAPQIKGIQDRAQQQKSTMAQFGNRSGGTNARSQTIDDTSRAGINQMISTLTGNAMSGALQAGQSLVDTGMQALNQQVQFSQDQMENWANSILGKGITSAISAGESYGMGKLPGGMPA
jgi:hypothetical protein